MWKYYFVLWCNLNEVLSHQTLVWKSVYFTYSIFFFKILLTKTISIDDHGARYVLPNVFYNLVNIISCLVIFFFYISFFCWYFRLPIFWDFGVLENNLSFLLCKYNTKKTKQLRNGPTLFRVSIWVKCGCNGFVVRASYSYVVELLFRFVDIKLCLVMRITRKIIKEAASRRVAKAVVLFCHNFFHLLSFLLYLEAYLELASVQSKWLIICLCMLILFRQL